MFSEKDLETLRESIEYAKSQHMTFQKFADEYKIKWDNGIRLLDQMESHEALLKEAKNQRDGV